jgi:hypothetical protein
VSCHWWGKQTCHWWKKGIQWKHCHDRPAALKISKLTISKYLALIFPVTIQNFMLFFIIRPVNIIDLCPLLNGKIKQAQGAGASRRNDAADEWQHKHKKSHDMRLFNVNR